MVIGLLGTEFQQVGVSVLAQRIRMAQVMGTLEAEVATPAAPWMVLGAPPVYEFVVAAVRSAAYLLGAKLLLGLDLSHANWSSLLVAVPLIVAAFSGLGLLAAATTMLVRRLNPVAMVIGSLSFFLSGVMYPVTVLPAWLREVGRLLPLTHALAVLRGALLVGAGAGRSGPVAAGAARLCRGAGPGRRRHVRLRPSPRPHRRLAFSSIKSAIGSPTRASDASCYDETSPLPFLFASLGQVGGRSACRA